MNTMPDEMKKRLEAEDALMERGEKLVFERYGGNLPVITHIVIASDYAHWDELNDQYLSSKPDFEKHVWQFGSYARMDWAVNQLNNRKVSAGTFYVHLPMLWVMSDPDDTDPRFLKVWKTARARNRRVNSYVTDNSQYRLPQGDLLDIYRGQMNDDGKYGISWTLDYRVALKFAKGAWYRCPMPGIVYVSQVRRKNVLAYLNGRNEQEVIIDPKDLIVPQVFARYIKKGG